MRYRIPLAAWAIVGLGAAGARASVEAYQYSAESYTTLSTQGGEVAGVTYSTLGSAITFNSLGFIDIPADPSNYNYDYGPDGLAGSYPVGIWLNSDPTTLLASTTVTPASTAIGTFLYAPIPATTIPANTAFTIAALLPDNPALDPWLMNAVSINSSDITGPGSGRILSGATTLSFPGTNGGATFAIVNASTAVVPEPAAGMILIIGGLAMQRRRRRRISAALRPMV